MAFQDTQKRGIGPGLDSNSHSRKENRLTPRLTPLPLPLPQSFLRLSPAMNSAPSKLYSDDVSLVVVLLDTNPFFWAAGAGGGNTSPHHPAATLPFAKFLNHVIPFLNSVLLLNQLNQVVLIATGVNSCGYIYDSAGGGSHGGNVPAVCSEILRRLEEFVAKDRRLGKGPDRVVVGGVSSLLSGSLSLALCYIQRVFRSGALHPQPRILCLQASPDGPEQYVAVMNAIFSAQRSMVPIDSCVIGVQHSAFLQQASYITGGVYLKPQQLDGLFQYLAAVFATDLQSRNFLQLPKPAGVDFRASCFCHKKTIDMGYVCSVCLSIFCKHHKKCSTCGSEFNQSPPDASATSDRKRKVSEV
ncbi:general transcription and DNA repair factor IIH subunit TFB4 isoform X1 [Phoenix dactylifera]|uniref:General transcription and DNA repair factor IIH subunit TFB4 n=1 Tax=Phoenix dactylifera TaxID=42345 RepID=A0A8B8J9B2_PHODC|nr:general transcription and DNA repair factor IIH subunit TFB4 isoform X1 [Phoenix dactylifera]